MGKKSFPTEKKTKAKHKCKCNSNPADVHPRAKSAFFCSDPRPRYQSHRSVPCKKEDSASSIQTHWLRPWDSMPPRLQQVGSLNSHHCYAIIPLFSSSVAIVVGPNRAVCSSCSRYYRRALCRPSRDHGEREAVAFYNFLYILNHTIARSPSRGCYYH